jgi:hypothetical protein
MVTNLRHKGREWRRHKAFVTDNRRDKPRDATTRRTRIAKEEEATVERSSLSEEETARVVVVARRVGGWSGCCAVRTTTNATRTGRGDDGRASAGVAGFGWSLRTSVAETVLKMTFPSADR